MGVSPYIDLLVAREKRQAEKDAVRPGHAGFDHLNLNRVIEFHVKRAAECDSAIVGMHNTSDTNVKALKFRQHKQMHEMTVIYLKKLKSEAS